jgi:hypothetical protein
MRVRMIHNTYVTICVYEHNYISYNLIVCYEHLPSTRLHQPAPPISSARADSVAGRGKPVDTNGVHAAR